MEYPLQAGESEIIKTELEKLIDERKEKWEKEARRKLIRNLLGSVAGRREMIMELSTYHDFEKLVDELPF